MDECGEVFWRGKRIFPECCEAGRERGQCTLTVLVLKALLNGGTEREPVRAGPEEASAVRSVLHVVRKSDEFFVIIEMAGVQQGDDGAGQAGGTRTNQQHAIAGFAEGAVLGRVVRNKYLDDVGAMTLAAGAILRFVGVDGPA